MRTFFKTSSGGAVEASGFATLWNKAVRIWGSNWMLKPSSTRTEC